MKFRLILLFCFCSLLGLNVFIDSEDSDTDGDEFITVRSPDGNLVNCGVERWAIKTCTDGDTSHVNFNIIVPSTIGYQRSLPTPPTLPPNNRLPLEDTVYTIDCKLARYKLETDGDVHCVITGNNNADTMVSEICDPLCPGISQTSRFGELTILRNWFVSNYHPASGWQYPNINIRITGVGFFDFQHGQIGIPRNGREIHPILTMVLLTGTEPISGTIPQDFRLYQNYPNPFNPVSKIRFDLPKEGNVKLVVYDLQGHEVVKLVDNEFKHAGSYSIDFNGSNLPSGVYFYRLETRQVGSSTGDFVESKKMILVK
jgi:hypothetical protein